MLKSKLHHVILCSKPPITSHHTQNESWRPYFDLPYPVWPDSSLVDLIYDYISSSPLSSSSMFSLSFLKCTCQASYCFVFALIFSCLECSFTKYLGSPSALCLKVISHNCPTPAWLKNNSYSPLKLFLFLSTFPNHITYFCIFVFYCLPC